MRSSVPDLGDTEAALVAKKGAPAFSDIDFAALMAGDDLIFKSFGTFPPKLNFGRFLFGLRVLEVGATMARAMMVSLVSASARRDLASASGESAGLCWR